MQLAIEEANRILASEELLLSPYFWERDAIPAKGDGYAQTVINQKVAEETDIMVVVMHNRVGTATPNATSGTIEEFNLAHEINESKSRSIEICIYFSVAPISPLIDLDQLKLVQEFRDRVHELGYLSRHYDNVSDLSRSLIGHLVDKARKFGSPKLSKALTKPSSNISLPEEIDESIDEELGFLDYEEIISKEITSATGSLEEIGGLIGRFGEYTARYTKKLEDALALTSAGATVDRKALIDSYADELSRQNESLEPLVSSIESTMPAGASAALSMLQEWPLDSEEARGAVSNFSDILDATISQSDGLIEPISTMTITLEGWPGLTKKLKISRRRAVEIHRRLHNALERSRQTMAEASGVARRRLSEFN